MSKGKRVSYSTPVPLPFGWGSVVLSGGDLVAVIWEASRDRVLRSLERAFPAADPLGKEGDPSSRFLREYADGRAHSADEILGLPIAWNILSGFQRNVLSGAAKIPYAATVSYGELASAAGSPFASRAAGGALSRNPWPVIVPCHRVIGKDGTLVGFGKGVEAKRILLEFEKRNSSR